MAAIHALFAENKAQIDQHGVKIGIVFFAVGKAAMAIEPLFYWDDPQHYLHNRVEQRSDLVALAAFKEPPAATRFVFALRERLKTVMQAHGAVHVQIAKTYDYLGTREPRLARLLKDIKASVDPENRINPGSLAL